MTIAKLARLGALPSRRPGVLARAVGVDRVGGGAQQVSDAATAHGGKFVRARARGAFGKRGSALAQRAPQAVLLFAQRLAVDRVDFRQRDDLRLFGEAVA